ncbi:hypothetical protein IQ07DRAFT_318284 [Pyrenochaeta sp. DS3sAY3a]|nr:hypothetical protein IQ07DRAFT_318284 [Pyrenochaeta sp. DS3sAY3a]
MAPKRKASLAGLDESTGTVQKKQDRSTRATRATRATTRATARAATSEKGPSAKTGEQDQGANPAQAGKSTGVPKTNKLKGPSAKIPAKVPAKKSSKKADPKNDQNVPLAATITVQAERSATPSRPSHSPPNTASESIEVIARENLRPGEVPPQVTPIETINELKKQGFEFPELPGNDEEALEWHRQASSKKPQNNDEWIKQAEKDLEARIAKGDRNPIFQRVNSSGPDKTPNWHTPSSEREPGGAEVDAVMNAATIPPFGYSGCIRDLIKNEMLPPDEIELARANRAATIRWASKFDEPEKGKSSSASKSKKGKSSSARKPKKGKSSSASKSKKGKSSSTSKSK